MWLQLFKSQNAVRDLFALESICCKSHSDPFATNLHRVKGGRNRGPLAGCSGLWQLCECSALWSAGWRMGVAGSIDRPNRVLPAGGCFTGADAWALYPFGERGVFGPQVAGTADASQSLTMALSVAKVCVRAAVGVCSWREPVVHFRSHSWSHSHGTTPFADL